MKTRIRSIGSYAPQRVMKNDELAKIVDTSDEWIYSHTGIRSRHIAADDQACSDLALEACTKALDGSGGGAEALKPEDIDLILVATASPDYLGFPSTASIVQEKLGSPAAGAMDLVAACTGFAYALETAVGFVEAGRAQRVLVVGAEVFSRIVNWEDRGTCVLFGDGAGAVVVEAATDDVSVIGKGYLRSQGSGAEHLLRPAGGTCLPFIPGSTPESELMVKMNGRQVYLFAVNAIAETLDALMELNGVTFDDIDWVVPHQANLRIIEATCKRKGWDVNKFYMNMEEYANTSAASIPLAMDELVRAGKLKRGMKVLTVGFGGGLSYGGNFFTF